MAIYSDITEIVKRLDILYFENISKDSDKGKYCYKCKRFLPFEKFPTRKRWNRVEYINPTCQDCIDEEMAIKGLTMIVRNYLYEELHNSKRYLQLERLIEKTTCSKNCKYAEAKIIYYYYKDERCTEETYVNKDNCPACKYCDKRNEIFDNIKYEMKIKVEKTVTDIIENSKDIIKLRIILNKLSKKLKNYDAS